MVKNIKKNINPHTTMYVSYAKDIFVALADARALNDEDLKTSMQGAIKLVKQAREAFQ